MNVLRQTYCQRIVIHTCLPLIFKCPLFQNIQAIRKIDFLKIIVFKGILTDFFDSLRNSNSTEPLISILSVSFKCLISDSLHRNTLNLGWYNNRSFLPLVLCDRLGFRIKYKLFFIRRFNISCIPTRVSSIYTGFWILLRIFRIIPGCFHRISSRNRKCRCLCERPIIDKRSFFRLI